MSRTFYEVQTGALNKWAAQYVEKQDPQFRVAPTPNHVFVSTRSLFPALIGSAGWIDASEYPLRELKGKKDKPIVDAILNAERRVAEKLEKIFDREKALRDIQRSVSV